MSAPRIDLDTARDKLLAAISFEWGTQPQAQEKVEALEAMVAVVRAQLYLEHARQRWNEAVDSRCHESVESVEPLLHTAREALHSAMEPFRPAAEASS